jgi:predicted DCC family thiol-disulfide oxidoreductase YuxK
VAEKTEVTVLYDEVCGFCTSLASHLERRGVRTAPIGSATGARLLRDLTPEQRYASVHVVDGEGRRASGGAAVPAILRQLPGGRPLAALCTLFPGVAEAAYGLVAGHRTLISRWLGMQLQRDDVEAPVRDHPASTRPGRSRLEDDTDMSRNSR